MWLILRHIKVYINEKYNKFMSNTFVNTYKYLVFSGDFSSFIYQPVLSLYFYVGGFSRILRMDHFVDVIKKSTTSTKEVEVPFSKVTFWMFLIVYF